MAEIRDLTNLAVSTGSAEAEGMGATPTAATDAPSSCPARILPTLQDWTSRDPAKAYPLVDRSYLNVHTGEVVHDYRGSFTFGPPSLDVYWHNRGDETTDDPWRGFATYSTLTMTEYVTRLGGFLGECDGRLDSLTATTYSINVVLIVDISRSDMRALRRKHGL